MKHVFKATKLGWEKEKKGYGLIQRLETILSGPFTIDFAKISRGFYAPPIDIHCNHQRRLNHKIQRNGGVKKSDFRTNRSKGCTICLPPVVYWSYCWVKGDSVNAKGK